MMALLMAEGGDRCRYDPARSLQFFEFDTEAFPFRRLIAEHLREVAGCGRLEDFHACIPADRMPEDAVEGTAHTYGHDLLYAIDPAFRQAGHAAARDRGFIQVYRRFMRYMGRTQGIGAWWGLNAAILDRMVARTSAVGIPLVVTYVPGPERAPLPAIRNHLEPLGVPVVDLQTAGVQENHYFAVDAHLNPAGHRFMAEAIAARIRQSVPRIAK